MTSKNEINDKNHYLYEDYEDIKRWNSYFVQANAILELNPKNVLEVGKGLGFIKNYLASKGTIVKTLDIDKTLKPDYEGDVRSMPIKDNQFDVVSCFQVLEHIPFNDFKTALRELRRVTKKYCVISLPYHTLFFWINFRFPGIPITNFTFRLPILSNKKTKFHYWEMGKIGFSKNKIRQEIREAGFKIIKEKSVLMNEYHYFFILEK